MIELLDQLHIGKHVGIACEIKRAPIGETQHITGRLSAVNDLAIVQNAATVYGVGRGEQSLPAICCDPPLFIGRVFCTPFDSSQWQLSKIATTSGENFLASGTASWM